MKRVAVIDLGTNTFHILIVQGEDVMPGKYQIIAKERVFVHLGEGGIDYISDMAWRRGLSTLKLFKEVIGRCGVSDVYAIGTAALRNASNGKEFIAEVKEKLGLDIYLISGDTEAELICAGVRKAYDFGDQKQLIMDIGGGSVEFIIADSHTIFWKESYPLGASISRQEFHQAEPIDDLEVATYQVHIEEVLQPLFKAAKEHQVSRMIGASGAFDTIASTISAMNREPMNTPFNEIDLIIYRQLHEELLSKTYEERLKINGMPPKRAKMIVVSSVLVDYVIDRLGITSLYQTDYALKEGIINYALNDKERLTELLKQ